MASSFLGLVARSIATCRLVASEGPRRSRPRHRKEVRNERIFRFVCFKSVARGPYAGARPLRGGSPVAVVEDLAARPVPARATLYARSRPEMAGEARQRALDLRRPLATPRTWIPQVSVRISKMLSAVILVCSLILTPDLRECSRDNAIHVLQVPEEFALPFMCAMRGETSIGQELAKDERIKVMCVRHFAVGRRIT